jgi:carbon-monoxide dehydrogenase catalytic subunit
MKYLYEDTRETLGSVMVVELDPLKLADRIVSDIQEKRKTLGWK